MNKNVIKEYNDGISLNKLAERYRCAYGTVKRYLVSHGVTLRDRSSACKLDKLLNPQKHSDETKQKLSAIRKKYLREHPDKVPYLLNHSSTESYPEKRFRELLEAIGLTGWVQHYRHSIYQYDFAFPVIKLDVEIDGNTHTLPDVIKKDIERDTFSSEQGWKVLRFTASEFSRDAGRCIDILLETIKKLDSNYDPYDVNVWNELKGKLHKQELHKLICPMCKSEFEHRDKRTTYCSDKCYRVSIKERERKVKDRPSAEALIMDIKSTSFAATGRKYGVSDNTIRKWLKSYDVDPKEIKNVER